MIFAGIDIGSRTIKAVLFDAEFDEILASAIADQGTDQAARAEELYQSALEGKGLRPRDVARVVATGYGRNAVPFADTTITEITCHAAGVRHLVPDAMTVIDIGGQDSKLIRLAIDGSVRDFAMNDRCAAGTGRFLEIVAGRLGVPLGQLGEMAAKSSKPAPLTSTCAVFAETEIVGLLAVGALPEDIAAGVEASLASRMATMGTGRVDPPVVFTGGVALLPGMVRALGTALAQEVTVAPNPQFTGALGAAILAGSR